MLEMAIATGLGHELQEADHRVHRCREYRKKEVVGEIQPLTYCGDDICITCLSVLESLGDQV